MDSDRELLELAAKAAGLSHQEIDGNGVWLEEDICWNPLTDDGDALRLAVRLAIRVEPMAHYCVAYAGSVCAAQFSEMVLSGDSYAATRRAIVRAAAGLGKV